jgi:hypothetical protein
MSQKVVVALYDHYADARAAVSEVMQAGVSGHDIALLANDSNGDHPGLTLNPAYAREQFDEDSEKQPRFITFGEIGIGIGGVLGFLATVNPVTGPMFENTATWVVVVSGAVIGLIVGVAAGFLTGHDLSTADTSLYSEGLKRGGTLVTALVNDGEAAKVSGILKGRAAALVTDRPAGWSAEGWVSLDVGHADEAAVPA